MDNGSINDPYWSHIVGMSEPLHQVIGVYLILLVGFAIVFNCLVLYVLVRDKTLRDGPSYLLLSITVGYLLVAATIYPLTIVSSFANTWISGKAGCMYNGFGGFFYNAGNMMTVSLITMERYYYVCRPVQALTVWSGEKTKIYICLSWLYVTIICLLPFLGWGEYAPEPYGRSCTINWFNPTWNNLTYTMFCMVTTYVVPLALMLYYSLKLGLGIRGYGSTINPTADDGNGTHINYRRKVVFPTMTSMALLMIHIVCWTPYAWVGFLGLVAEEYKVDRSNVDYYAISPNFAKLACCLNPLAIVLGYSKVRAEVLKLLRFK